MLEESRMDKKSLNRSSQPQSRASAVDCKKNTELTHKPWPRNNKKREGTGNGSKNEPFRKNVSAQKGRGQLDKRPRARGGASNFVVGGAQNTRLEEDEEPEIGSVFVPGSKKQNLNHLLNFMYPSRGSQDRMVERRGPTPRRQVQRAPLRLEHDLYLRANCQFVVREDGDYMANLLDPDMPVKWEQIEEIVVRSVGALECPICLGAPAAGRAGRCGHVFCWGCALHLRAAHAAAPALPPCPVCAQPLHVLDMRPAAALKWAPPAHQITMRLVRRLRGSMTVEVAPPRGQVTNDELAPMLPLERVKDAPYCKFFIATKQQIRDILERERKEIQDQIMAEIDTTEIEYLEQALELLKQKEDKINNTMLDHTKLVDDEVDNVPVVYETQQVQEQRIDWFDKTDDESFVETIEDQVQDLASSIALSCLDPEAPEFGQDDFESQSIEFPLTEDSPTESVQIDDNAFSDIDQQNKAKYFYFYQAEDGQQVFLNSLNVRILNASWGTLAAAPLTIRGRVLHRETRSLNEQMRNHMPFTAHLPLYCSFDIVELDLQPPHVKEEALKSYAEELERRARFRARQERDERRRERAQRRALEGPPRPDFSSAELFPPAPPPLASPPEALPPLVTPPDLVSPSTSATSPPGPSFAKMASTGGAWRVRKPAPAPPPPPDEEESLVPRALSLSDAIEAALLAPPPPAGKKNKKAKQKVLFATGMQRSS